MMENGLIYSVIERLNTPRLPPKVEKEFEDKFLHLERKCTNAILKNIRVDYDFCYKLIDLKRTLVGQDHSDWDPRVFEEYWDQNFDVLEEFFFEATN
jgi:hypothetical protein